MKNISILGSTGSIGTQSLEVIDRLGNYKVVGLSTNSKVELLSEQIIRYRPEHVCVADTDKVDTLKKILREKNYHGEIDIYIGEEGLVSIAKDESELLINSLVGMVGLVPTLEAIARGKDIGLANKETLVTAGEIVTREARRKNVNIIPIDSEHSAIFQCMNGEKESQIEKIILTASGGPFRGRKRDELKDMGVKDALNHPNWTMGSKISIDSATLMNKGLEIIEAYWLFDVELKDIEAIVHPQSIIHSMVEYVDSSTIAHLGMPDMKVPIQYALTHPDRYESGVEKLDLKKVAKLTFEEVDEDTFKPILLARKALNIGGTMPAVLNGANEKLVELFLSENIGFLDIIDGIEKVMKEHSAIDNPSLEEILQSDIWAREKVLELYS